MTDSQTFELGSQGPQSRNWPSINRANDRADASHNRHSRILGPISAVRRFGGSGLGNYPFRLYQPSWAQLGTGFDITTLWRTFLVRSGQVNGAPLTGPGCDGYNTNPDDDLYPLDDTDDTGAAVAPVTIPIPTSGPYYFWIDTTVLPVSNPNGEPLLGSGFLTQLPVSWATFPQPDGVHWVIGSVTLTAADATAGTPQSATIRQSIRADIWDAAASGGGIYQAFTQGQVIVEKPDYVIVLLNGNGIAVAKPPTLRASLYNQAISDNGGVWSLGTSPNQRYETVNGVQFVQFIRPSYMLNRPLYISKPVGGTSAVDVGGVPIIWQDMNVDARKFETVTSDCYNGQDVFWRLCCEPYTTAAPTK